MSIFDGAVKGDKFVARDGGVWEFVEDNEGRPYGFRLECERQGLITFHKDGGYWGFGRVTKNDIIRKLPKQQTAKPNKKMDLAITRHPQHEGWVCSPEFCESETVFTADELFDLAREIQLVEKALDVLNGKSDG
jgi:hypothetical protein